MYQTCGIIVNDTVDVKPECATSQCYTNRLMTVWMLVQARRSQLTKSKFSIQKRTARLPKQFSFKSTVWFLFLKACRWENIPGKKFFGEEEKEHYSDVRWKAEKYRRSGKPRLFEFSFHHVWGGNHEQTPPWGANYLGFSGWVVGRHGGGEGGGARFLSLSSLLFAHGEPNCSWRNLDADFHRCAQRCDRLSKLFSILTVRQL